jgi:hypothetical protein
MRLNASEKARQPPACKATVLSRKAAEAPDTFSKQHSNP